MINKAVLKILIILGIFFAFSAVYKLLEKEQIYNSTLGKMTLNYQRIDSSGISMIKEMNKPFSAFVENNAYNWDAKYYKDIHDYMYEGSGIFIIYRYAFYPFFPMVWKLFQVQSHGIVFLNYLFFALSLLLLSSIFLKDSKSEIFFFMLGLLLPTAIAFYLPYTEALFLLTFSIALIGLLKRKYWLFFIAMLCFSMTRPSAMILYVVFIIANFISLLHHKQILRFLKECFLSILPIFTGWVIVMLMEYHYSGSWTSYMDASYLWAKEPDLHKKVSDWSMEGFGMTSFALFAIAIPAIIYVIVWGVSALLGKKDESTPYLFSGDGEYIKTYLFNASLLFIMGTTIFNFMVGGYQLNGIFRYTMATPFFYIVFFQLPEKLKSIPVQYKVSGLLILLFSILLFLLSTDYAGDIFRFKYLGLYLLLLLAPLVILEQYLPDKMKLFLLVLLVVPCLVWHAYLFNMYLSDAWIFT